MLKLKIISVGRMKEEWLKDAFNDYIKRLQPYVHIENIWAKDNAQLIEWTQKEKDYLCLDPSGRLFTSENLSAFFIQQWEKGGSRLIIVIGGAEGIPSDIKENKQLISLSPLTFTHQMTQLILIEQIYRTIEIQKGTSYHK